MDIRYPSFSQWQPKDEEFSYDRNPLIKDGYRLRARLDKRNPDVQLLCTDLENEGKQVKVIDIEPEMIYIDIWYK